MVRKKTSDNRPRLKTSYQEKPPEHRRARPAPRRPRGVLAPATGRPRTDPIASGRLAEAPVRPLAHRSAMPAAIGGESHASASARDLAIAIAIAALDKKAAHLEILDVAGQTDYADFLVLMTGRSDRHVAALAQGIEQAVRTQGKRPMSVEGMPQARWVLLDYGDVVVHVFEDELRGVYDLDDLWRNARRVPIPEGEP